MARPGRHDSQCLAKGYQVSHYHVGPGWPEDFLGCVGPICCPEY